MVIAQLLYNLDTIQLNEANLNKLDAFQQRGLRTILNVEPAWIGFVSNEQVFEIANRIKLKKKLNKYFDYNQSEIKLPTKNDFGEMSEKEIQDWSK